jgi:hypothetical protein
MMHKALHRSTAIGNITRLGKKKPKIILVYLELFTFNLPINLEI